MLYQLLQLLASDYLNLGHTYIKKLTAKNWGVSFGFLDSTRTLILTL